MDYEIFHAGVCCISPQEKEKILEEEYDIETTIEMEGGMQQMCNLSERIEERGIKKGIVAKGLLDKEAAAAELGISVEEFVEGMQRNSL